MSHSTDSPSETRPAATATPDDKIPLAAKTAYGFGGVNDIFGHWLYPNLSGAVFTMHLKLSPGLVGNVLMISRLFDAFTDPLFGWISDNTRTRWGRRRPYILFGSIAAGIALPCLFLASSNWDTSAPWQHNHLFWFMMISMCLYAPIISLYNMPYQSLGSELTPSYHERTVVMGYKAIIQKISGIFLAASWWFANLSIFKDAATGKTDVLRGVQWAAALAGFIMICAGFANFFFVKERYYHTVSSQPKTRFWKTLGETFRSRPFVVLLAVSAVYIIPSTMLGDFSRYVGTYYVFGGDQAMMSKYYLYGSIGYFAWGVLGVFTAGWIAKHHGKRKGLLFTLVTGILAFGSSWWMYTPGNGWMTVLNTSLTGFTSTGLWVVLPSMCVDVVDDDELRSGQRREGAFTSWYSWVSKVGISFSFWASGHLLELVGYRAELEANQTPEAIWWMRFLFATIPVVALLIAAGLLAFYPLSQARMQAIRAQLEARRGTV